MKLSTTSKKVLRGLVVLGVEPLGLGQVGARSLDEAVDIEKPNPLAGVILAEAEGLELGGNELGNAEARRAGPEEQDALVGELAARLLQAGGDPGQRDRRGALDVVIVAQHTVLVAVEHADRVGALPVLEMHTGAGEDLANRLDELLGQLVEFGLARRQLAGAEIVGVGAQVLVRGADIEQDGQEHIRRHGGAGGVELQLADRDAHAVRTDVAEAEDAAAGRDADEAHVLLGPVAQPPPSGPSSAG